MLVINAWSQRDFILRDAAEEAKSKLQDFFGDKHFVTWRPSLPANDFNDSPNGGYAHQAIRARPRCQLRRAGLAHSIPCR